MFAFTFNHFIKQNRSGSLSPYVELSLWSVIINYFLGLIRKNKQRTKVRVLLQWHRPWRMMISSGPLAKLTWISATTSEWLRPEGPGMTASDSKCLRLLCSANLALLAYSLWQPLHAYGSVVILATGYNVTIFYWTTIQTLAKTIYWALRPNTEWVKCSISKSYKTIIIYATACLQLTNTTSAIS